MKVLHLSDTTLSGAPYRAQQLFNKHSGHEARHIVWHPIIFDRIFPTDLVGCDMSRDELEHWLEWADIIHFHNRWKRLEMFRRVKMPKKKKMVIQIHSPRNPQDQERGFKEEVDSGVPIAVIAQYHVRQWPELSYIIPNVVDITDPSHMPIEKQHNPLVNFGYAPSSPNGKGWDNKSYDVVNPVLKKMFFQRQLLYTRIVGKPFWECLEIKQKCDVGIDEVSTGSYHMASLEFLSMGVATMAAIDSHQEKVVKDLTGCDELPWIVCKENEFAMRVREMIRDKPALLEIGRRSRGWMEKYWSPEVLCDHLLKMYEDL